MPTLKRALLYLMAVLYIAAGLNHFRDPEFYTNIMPPYLPWHLGLVYASGVAEVVLGLMLLWRKTRAIAAWGILAMLLVFYMVHLHMLMHSELFPEVPVALLWVRMFLQVVLIAWAWWYTREGRGAQESRSSS